MFGCCAVAFMSLLICLLSFIVACVIVALIPEARPHLLVISLYGYVGILAWFGIGAIYDHATQWDKEYEARKKREGAQK